MSTTNGRHGPVAVLVSGGPDSAILVGELAATSPQVTPIYVRFGMIWEDAEEQALRQFLERAAPAVYSAACCFQHADRSGLRPALERERRPGSRRDQPRLGGVSPRAQLLLLAQTSIWCHLQKVPVIALGLLKGNPFPDSSDTFFASFEGTVNLAVDSSIQIVRPYQHLTKKEVLQRGAEMPLGLTWSCMRPMHGKHCGDCNKCAERQKAFREAGIVDPTNYESGKTFGEL